MTTETEDVRTVLQWASAGLIESGCDNEERRAALKRLAERNGVSVVVEDIEFDDETIRTYDYVIATTE